MKPIMQTIFNADFAVGETGDCFSACVASIFELPLEGVPNFSHAGAKADAESPTGWSSDWWYLLRDWLRQRGFVYIEFPVPGSDADLLAALGWHIMVGKSPRGEWNHAVVGRHGVIEHDPHPDGTGLRSIDSFGIFVALDPAGVGTKGGTNG